jgi:two-component system OmpR family response regulator/two-component system response regulator QseB
VAARILIVEDSPLVTEAFSILLRESGYEVDIAGTIAEAVETTKTRPADLILLDISLPDGDGLDLLDQLSDQQSLPKATLAMTGHGDTRTRQKCLDAGCAEVFLKPVGISELLRRIEHHLA